MATTTLTSTSSKMPTPSTAKDPALVDTYGNPFQIPNYTMTDVRNAIPKHCFERSAVTGLYYVAKDLLLLASTFYLFNRFVTPDYVPWSYARAGLWFCYTVLQGFFGTGLWIMAHECGHQSFSPSKALNDSVGWVCHSILLVPYFSWKISHRKHHQATGNMERDMAFVPLSKVEYVAQPWHKLALQNLEELTEETPIMTALQMIAHQLIGWPLYLFTNASGHNNHEKQREGRGKGKTNGFGGGVNHFDPASPLYEQRDAPYILLSDLGLLITTCVLVHVGRTYGFHNLFVWYIAPYLWVNHWLVAITFLQHTDPSLPHYTGSSWTSVRGAAATIDREFGFIGRSLMHGIVETHVLHHHISTIPFYHADEATEAIKKVLGDHYRSDTKDGSIGFVKSLWKSFRWCNWVEPVEGSTGDAGGVLFFRNRNGLGVGASKCSNTVALTQ
ncbi:hypothetical protein LTR10_018251 [Elasticomyces elasticus]|uniref:Oleate hydroxylase fah12 n=1 Tax=Exophiala sideris TaxID=1016849 RepID=A0ABR0JIS6_9EURO|nr:hypothetical protein LTR10_018251 [Elasticomyces elasticus]KAK5034507.1 Oleate hydroxylase fah12 [Exophiala sideris]KAK5042803.1 hypothetical protein LTR13_001651 [Exophiala sideris]KAK5065886.1 Oleate hydroxylase fah12 [Exophiala sideris]KAK5185652.1 hypothetical protein LTR44_001701 [Eurotiomycetes sp. CCFEE 6388]